MVVAISRFTVPAAAAAELAKRFESRSHLVDHHDGFLGMDVLAGGVAEREFLLVMRWRDRAALAAYMRSEDFRAVHANGEELDASFKLYDVIAH